MGNERQIEIESRPIKKVTIFEVLELSIDDFLNRLMLLRGAGQPVAASWADGIVFFFFPFNVQSDMLVEEALKGHIYLANVVWAHMAEYEPIKRVSGLEIPIINQTVDPVSRQIASWVKTRGTGIH